MRYDIDLFGVFIPTLLMWLLVTYALGIAAAPAG